MASILDISVPVFPGMLHPGRQPESIAVEQIAAGDSGNVSRWHIGAHTGTHLEAPLHTQPDGATIDTLKLDLLVGAARVLDLTGVEGAIRPADLLAAGLDHHRRVLLHTTNSERVLHSPEKPSRWVGLSPEAAQLLVDHGVRLLGFDFYTVETAGRDSTFDAHYILSGAGIVTIEQVDLTAVPAGDYELVCLPVPMRGAEAAPARVVLLPAPEASAGVGHGDVSEEAGDGDDGADAARPLIDVSVPVHGQMLHWGKRPVVEVVESFDNGNACNVSRWLIGSHTGLHVDAQLHFVDGGWPIDELDLDVLIGPARVLDLTAVDGEDITAADLHAAGLGDESRVLLKTENSSVALKRSEIRDHHWVGLAPDAAQLLIDRGVKLVSIDFITIDSPARDQSWDVHHLLLPAGVAIVECLDLATVPAGLYELVCLPLKLRGSEAAPGGGFLRPLSA
jgi:arylformamidase